VLLKLEAGSPRDRLDILGLISAQIQLKRSGWMKDLPGRIPYVSPEAQKTWEKLQDDFPADAG